MTELQIIISIIGILCNSGIAYGIFKALLKSEVETIVKPIIKTESDTHKENCHNCKKEVDRQFDDIKTGILKENERLNDSIIRLETKVDNLTVILLKISGK